MTLNIISVVPFYQYLESQFKHKHLQCKKTKTLTETNDPVNRHFQKCFETIDFTDSSIRAPTGARKRSKSYNYFRMQTTMYIVVA